jgi:hypothetical protein
MIAIEYRNEDKGQEMEADLIYIASTKKIALKWMKDNINYNPEDDLWWWAIYTVEADKELEWNDLEFYNPQGNKLEDQPVR